MSTLPKFETERLLVRIPDARDARRFAEYFERNDDHFAPWSIPRPEGFTTARFWRERLPLCKPELERGIAARFIFLEKKKPRGAMIGEANLTQIFRGAFMACYLGYSLDEEFVGKGYMTEGLARVLAFAFEDLGLHRVMANYVPTNERSAKVLSRLGFDIEGYARDYLFIDGQWRDHVLTAKSNPKLVLPSA
jgi:[ribosomal protein S5]-alanine N-acetyltransferase